MLRCRIEAIGEICALSAALVWSISLVLFKRSESISPQAMNLFKNGVAIGLLSLTMFAIGIGIDRTRTSEDWARLVASGLLGIAIADTLILMALRHLGAGLLAIVDCVYVPTIVILSVTMLGEKIGESFLAGAALILVGVLVATIEWERTAVPTAPTRRAKTLGVACGVIGILAMGVGVILAKPPLGRGHLVEVTFIRLLAGAVGQLVWITILPSRRGTLRVFRPTRVWATLLPAAICGSYVSMMLWLAGFKWAPASTAAVLNQTTSIFTIVLARVFLGEPLTLRRALGAAIAISGAMLVLAGRIGV